ncbi:MAG: glycosyl hydrolase [Planctomycetes bacterium]|nr:glycosyl hydrolase [Planctomycetota bacterium]
MRGPPGETGGAEEDAMRAQRRSSGILAWSVVLLAPTAGAARGGAGGDAGEFVEAAPVATTVALPAAITWRGVGPNRGGRVAAVCGHVDQPLTYWMGACGGGVWRTDDAGANWRNVSDGHFGGSIGAVAVAPADPETVYVGGGEVTVRGNWSPGWGAWKTSDGGRNWKSIGLADSQIIPRIRVDPRDSDVVYAAVLGHLCGPSEERGVYRSRDGGASWQRVLHVSPDAGACDLLIDPRRPRTLWATTWRVRRTPHSLESGGDGSGLWRSDDAGDTWTELSRRPGLPGGTLGIIGVAVSPARPGRVWAMVEAEDGGLFRSDDDGASWQRVNEDRNLRQRAWYYTRVYACPQDADRVYVLNVQSWRSEDGGRTFAPMPTPHGDHHDLWIAPNDSKRMIQGDDGGAFVSFDGSATYSSIENQPTAQLYRVSVDDAFPWRIYGAQQDNSTLRLHPFGDGVTRGGRNWEITAGGESGWLAPDPRDPEIVYGGSYGGYLERYDHRRREARNITAWPDNPIGHGAAQIRWRFQWNFPLLFSRHEPGLLYAAAQALFASRDEGQTFTPISPDLSRNDNARMQPSGGPITKDNTGVEVYGTIFAVAEAVHEKGVIWAGTDDGRLHVTRDGGGHWSDVTPKLLPEWAQINSIEPHPTEAGGLYVAATTYKLDDFRPWLFATRDWGRTWSLLGGGIPEDAFTRVIRADPSRPGLLFCGTERGAFVSFDDGVRWQPLQAALPTVPVTDLLIKDDTLVAATQGRSFWILDELALLRQLPATGDPAAATLVAPPPLRRRDERARFDAWLPEALRSGEVATLVVRPAAGDAAARGDLVRFSTAPQEGERPLTLAAGWNRVDWTPTWPDAKGFAGMILWGGNLSGPRALPGRYAVELAVGPVDATAPRRVQLATTLEIRRDPRQPEDPAELEERFEFLLAARDLLSRTHQSIERLRGLRGQLETLAGRLAKRSECADVKAQCEALAAKLTAIEEALYQTRLRSGQDPLNFPIRLNNKLADLASAVAGNERRPTAGAQAVRAELTAAIETELAAFTAIVDRELPALNRLAMERQVPAIFVQDS